MISAVILTKNEEKNIETCLRMLEWVDEIVVVDDNSTDTTLKTIQKLKLKNQNYHRSSAIPPWRDNSKVKVFRRGLGGDFAGQRNFGLEKAKGEWILFVDADERVSSELAKEIQVAVKKDEFDGYFLKRRDILYGQELQYGETVKVRLLRLVKKGTGQWVGRVHERYEGKKGSASWRRGELEKPLVHYPHQDLTEFLAKINFYSTLRAQELYDQGVRSNLGQIIFYPVGKFVKDWLFLGGWQDGMPGMVMAVMMSFHSFLTRSKLFLLAKKS
jgi:glycosyltransferase involved in cell wall biosynthesis